MQLGRPFPSRNLHKNIMLPSGNLEDFGQSLSRFNRGLAFVGFYFLIMVVEEKTAVATSRCVSCRCMRCWRSHLPKE